MLAVDRRRERRERPGAPGSVSLESWLGLAYLVVAGSLVAFTAYMWLLRERADVARRHVRVREPGRRRPARHARPRRAARLADARRRRDHPRRGRADRACARSPCRSGRSSPGRPLSPYAAANLNRMTVFDLRNVRVRSGEEHREAIEVEHRARRARRRALHRSAREDPGRARGHPRLDRLGLRAPARRAPARPVHALPRRRRGRGDAVAARVPGDEPRHRRADDAVPRRRPARPLRLGARLARPRAARQDPLPARLRRPLPGLRQGPERRAARARGGGDRPALGGARGAEGRTSSSSYTAPPMAVPKKKTSQVPPRQAPRPARHRGAAHERLPDLRAAEEPASRLPELQDVQGPRGRAAQHQPRRP